MKFQIAKFLFAVLYVIAICPLLLLGFFLGLVYSSIGIGGRVAWEFADWLFDFE